MSDKTLPVRLALYGLVSCLAAAEHSWALAVAMGAVAGISGLWVEKGLRSSFDGQIAFFATLALLTSAGTLGMNASEFARPLLFAAACLVFFLFAKDPSPGFLKLTLSAAISIAPAALDWSRASWWRCSFDNLLVALFGATGLLYGAPLLWGGFLGLLPREQERRGLRRLAMAAIVPGLLTLLLATDLDEPRTKFLTSLPFLLPGLAWCFERARQIASRRPARVVGFLGALLILWNLLFMEQYRRRGLPSDDTVSFAVVTSQSASLLSRFVGTPMAWPANWLFALRFGVPVERWDGAVSLRLFGKGASTARIEFGDDPSTQAKDSALLLEGFGARRQCEKGWCRDLYDAGRMLLPLDGGGQSGLALRLRVRGQGVLEMSLNGVATSVVDMSKALSEATLSVPARHVRPGINILSLRIAGGGKATVDQLNLDQLAPGLDLGSGSAR